MSWTHWVLLSRGRNFEYILVLSVKPSPGTNKAIVFPVPEPSQTFDKLPSHRPPPLFQNYCPFASFRSIFIYFHILFHIHKKRMAKSRQRRDLPEIPWCQNDRSFEGLLDYDFFWGGISIFLDFLGFLAILENKKSHRRSAGVKTTNILKAVQFI